jgi:hypothetical protein
MFTESKADIRRMRRSVSEANALAFTGAEFFRATWKVTKLCDTFMAICEHVRNSRRSLLHDKG